MGGGGCPLSANSASGGGGGGGGVHMYVNFYHRERTPFGPKGGGGGAVTQKLIRVKSDPAGSLLVAIIDPAGSLLAAKSDPPLQKVIRVQILVDSSLF